MQKFKVSGSRFFIWTTIRRCMHNKEGKMQESSFCNP